MKKSIIIFSCFLFYSYSNAQRGMASRVESYRSTVRNLENKDRFINNLNNQGHPTNTSTRYNTSKTLSSPFLFDEWNDGILILPDSTIIKEDIQFKFNAQRNEIWIKLNSGLIRILDNRELHALILKRTNQEPVVLRKYKLSDRHSNSHFSIALYEGKEIHLIKDVKRMFLLADEVEKGVATIGSPYDRYENITKYYLKIGSTVPQKIKYSRSAIISALKLPKDLRLKLENFAKNKNIQKKPTERELILLLDYAEKIFAKDI
jgi:hypothetical protein